MSSLDRQVLPAKIACQWIPAHTLCLQKKRDEIHQSGVEDALNGTSSGSPTTGRHLSAAAAAVATCPKQARRRQKSKTPSVYFAGFHDGRTASAPIDKDVSDDVVIGPMPNTHPAPPGDKQTRSAQIQAAFLCGVINGIITIPVMTSFAAIIFQARQ